jgi:hypothetical protein
MPTTITVEDVERFRSLDPRSVIASRHRLVAPDERATAAEGEIVYAVAGQRVVLRQIPGGYTADHDCRKCQRDLPCWRALAAVDHEGTERFIAKAKVTYRELKVETAR